MVENKTVKFGYGSVLVYGCEIFGEVEMMYVQPPKPVGNIEYYIDNINIIEEIVFKYDNDMWNFHKQLNDVSETNSVLKFRDYTFDFSNYNPESVRIVRSAFERSIRSLIATVNC